MVVSKMQMIKTHHDIKYCSSLFTYSTNARKAVDASIVAKQETTRLEGVTVGLTDAGKLGRGTHVCDNAVTGGSQTEFTQIQAVPSGLCILKDGSQPGVFVFGKNRGCGYAIGNNIGKNSVIGMVPSNAKTVTVHDVIVFIAVARVKGSILRQLHERVGGR